MTDHERHNVAFPSMDEEYKTQRQKAKYAVQKAKYESSKPDFWY